MVKIISFNYKKLFSIKNILIIFLILTLGGCRFNDRKTNIGKTIELDLNGCVIDKEIDTHEGFFNEGDYFVKIDCSNSNLESLSDNWEELPLSNELQTIIDTLQCDENICLNVYQKYNIPEIKDGYYYFLGKNSKFFDKYDDSILSDSYFYNFILAIYDIDNKIIYYYELDT